MAPSSRPFTALTLICLSPLVHPGEGVTERASVQSSGVQGNERSALPSISTDGRFVAFESWSTDLVPGDTNFSKDIFVHDRLLGTTERVSVSNGGAQANDSSTHPSVSADGRYVAFASSATNLVPLDTNNFDDIFVRDRVAGTTSLVSTCPMGSHPNGHSYDCEITPDGTLVVFSSSASDIIAGDDNNGSDIFVRDLVNTSNAAISLSSTGDWADGNSFRPAITPDGRFVVFDSLATDLVNVDTNGQPDVFRHDTQTGQTILVSLATSGAQGNSFSEHAALSDDGRYITFESRASTLVPNDVNSVDDIFMHDAQTGQTTIVSVDSAGNHGNFYSAVPAISADGRLVFFQSWSDNLVAGDVNSVNDIFVHDTLTSTTRRVSLDSAGVEPDDHCFFVDVSADGRFVAFQSDAENLVPDDTNGWGDIFVRDDLLRAAAAPRNAGANPVSLTVTAPVIGQNWTVDVDLTTTGHTSAAVIGFNAPVSVPLSGGQVLLVAGEYAFDLPLQSGPLASWSVPVANDPSLAGVQLHAQALHAFGVVPFALSNAQDLCLGY